MTVQSSSALGQVLLGGLTSGLLYALLLVGFLIVFQVSKSVNFAYGQVGMIGAFSAWYFMTELQLPLWLALLLGIVIAVLTNSAIDFLAIRRVPADRPGLDLVVTLGLFLFLAAAMQLLVDANSHSFPSLGSEHRADVQGVVVNANDLLVVVVALGVIGATYYLLHRTTLGTSLRASAENASIAESTGINVRRLRTGSWAVAGLIASLVAILTASRLSVDAFYMTPVLIKAFVAGMIGGMDRFVLPLAVAVGIGVYESLAVFTLGSSAGVPAVFLLIIVALAVIPKRFVADSSEVRA